jgi:hypothetical protein
MIILHLAVAAVLVVAPGGDDAGPGTAAQPWRTISHAAQVATPGSVVDVRAGVYNERVRVRVSGTAEAPIVFQAHEGEQVAISGDGLKRLGSEPGLIEIRDREHLVFSGFELRDLRGAEDVVASGVWVTGKSHDVSLTRLDVHDIRRRGGDDAHGIAVYGTTRTPIRNVAVTDSHVHDLALGSSEAVVFNGNVDGWAATGNTIEDVDNIGIDAIGFEKTAPVDDQARNGVIARNVIDSVNTRGNDAYKGCRCAGGIYVDGGHDILIEGNRVTRSDLGIELASEHSFGRTTDVLVRNNVILGSYKSGLTVGGYNRKQGRTVRVQIVNNTFANSDRGREGVGEIEINFRFFDSMVLNNVFRGGPENLLVTNQYRANRGNVFDGNVWWTSGRPRWQWRARPVRTFEAWQDATGGEASSSFADPLIDPAGRPGTGSPVIDAGVATPLAGGIDVDGNPRTDGLAIDAGAFEVSSEEAERRTGPSAPPA